MKIETIAVDRGGKPVLINKCDLTDHDVVWGAPKKAKEKTAKKKPKRYVRAEQ